MSSSVPTATAPRQYKGPDIVGQFACPEFATRLLYLDETIITPDAFKTNRQSSVRHKSVVVHASEERAIDRRKTNFPSCARY